MSGKASKALAPLANWTIASRMVSSRKNSSGTCMLSWNINLHLKTRFGRTDTEGEAAEKCLKISFCGVVVLWQSPDTNRY